tara:strand:- start:51 stop:488 length:438 start_codon:yes stop_codon:yes gene_type:complete
MTEGVIKAKPKKKKLGKVIGKALGSLLKPSKLLPIGGAALVASDIYDIGSEVYDNRKEFSEALSSPEGREALMSLGGSAFKDEIKDTFKPPEFFKPFAKATKKRKKEANKPQKYIKKKKSGGKVGRPKGVGCATRGYGKAMKRGK